MRKRVSNIYLIPGVILLSPPQVRIPHSWTPIVCRGPPGGREGGGKSPKTDGEVNYSSYYSPPPPHILEKSFQAKFKELHTPSHKKEGGTYTLLVSAP